MSAINVTSIKSDIKDIIDGLSLGYTSYIDRVVPTSFGSLPEILIFQSGGSYEFLNRDHTAFQVTLTINIDLITTDGVSDVENDIASIKDALFVSSTTWKEDNGIDICEGVEFGVEVDDSGEQVIVKRSLILSLGLIERYD
jgi:hypothetical protein